jgi:hypothetical protein
MFRRRGGAAAAAGRARDGAGNGSSRDNLSWSGSAASIDPELQGQAQEVMKDNLELMKDIVMKIREDPEFAKGIYKNCPRLQHLLDQYPDLRPIFEDPKLVRLNFEQVYRDAGGVLPEDEEKKKQSCLVWFVNSPIFKILKVLLFVKRLVMCILGGGLAFVTGCFLGCCYEDALEEVGEEDEVQVDAVDPSQEALNRAADHMEDPEVQEQMQRLLDDPENLQEAIENDPELRALRDSNPLCEELMSDPETMRVLTDPDNLRALGEAPSLIEADFVDPDSFVADADIETGGVDGGYDAFDGGGDTGDDGLAMETDEVDDGLDAGADDDVFADEVEVAEDDGWWEDAEVEATEVEAGGDHVATAETVRSSRAQASAEAEAEEQALAAAEGAETGNGGRFGGIMASIGVMATDLIAAQIVGSVFGDDLMGLMGGGGGEPDLDVAAVDNLDAAVAEVADAADQVTAIEEVAQAAEDTVEEVDTQAARAEQVAEATVEAADAAEEALEEEARRMAVSTGVAIGVGVAAAGGLAAAGGVMAVRAHRARDLEGKNAERGMIVSEEEVFVDEVQPVEAPKKNRFGLGAIRNFGASLATAAVEHVTTSFLGDDLGEQVIDGKDGVELKKKGVADEEAGNDQKLRDDDDDSDRLYMASSNSKLL